MSYGSQHGSHQHRHRSGFGRNGSDRPCGGQRSGGGDRQRGWSPGSIDHEALTIVGGLNRIADSLGSLLGNDQQAAAAGPVERTFSRYSVGTGTFYEQDGQGVIVVNGRMFTFGGEEDGEYEAVFRAWFTDPAQLLDYPRPSNPPYDEPSPVPQITDVNQTKAQWTFGDGSKLSGPGPAISYIAPVQGGWQFWVSAATFLTGGSGRYADAIGQETSLGSTFFAGDTPPVLEPGTTFDAKVSHTFRVILGRDRRRPEGGGGNGEGGNGGGGSKRPSGRGGKKGGGGGGEGES